MIGRLVGTALALAVAFPGCGTVEKNDEGPPCDPYCDHLIGDCGFPEDRTACLFMCECFHDGVVQEVADEFVRCVTDLPCDAESPELICSLTLAGQVEPTPRAEKAVAECNAKIDELGGSCVDDDGDEFDCGFAEMLNDNILDASEACFTETTCPEFTECVQGTLLDKCLGGGF